MDARGSLAGASLTIPQGPRSFEKRGQAKSSSGLSSAKKSRQLSTRPAGALATLVESEEEEDNDVPLVARRKRSSDTSSFGAPTSSSSLAPVSSSSGAPVPATPLLSQGGGDVFAAMVPPARSSFGFMKKKIAGPSSSSSLQLTSCQTSGAALRTES
ncbi:uncharacterized protein [Miscanthus floridulus]|uniref:uncharacterized protein n=1 Tax=Miscanthus floridulus TaxID=154761 RepID=UPI003457D5DC